MDGRNLTRREEREEDGTGREEGGEREDGRELDERVGDGRRKMPGAWEGTKAGAVCW